MSVEIPLGNYAGRGEADLPVVVKYSSKVWRFEVGSPIQMRIIKQTFANPRYAEQSASGWTSSLDPPRVQYTFEEQFYDFQGKPVGGIDDEPYQQQYFIKRIHIHLPDGSAHELRKDDAAHGFNGTAPNYDYTGSYYAVDGSRLRFDFDTRTLYLPDGSRYLFNGGMTATQFIDRNGNTLSYSVAWRRVSGRTL